MRRAERNTGHTTSSTGLAGTSPSHPRGDGLGPQQELEQAQVQEVCVALCQVGATELVGDQRHHRVAVERQGEQEEEEEGAGKPATLWCQRKASRTRAWHLNHQLDMQPRLSPLKFERQLPHTCSMGENLKALKAMIERTPPYTKCGRQGQWGFLHMLHRDLVV